LDCHSDREDLACCHVVKLAGYEGLACCRVVWLPGYEGLARSCVVWSQEVTHRDGYTPYPTLLAAHQSRG
jgi:hypothetical protein